MLDSIYSNDDFRVNGVSAVSVCRGKFYDDELFGTYFNEFLNTYMSSKNWALEVLKFRLLMLKVDPEICDSLGEFLNQTYQEIFAKFSKSKALEADFAFVVKFEKDSLKVSFLASLDEFVKAKTFTSSLKKADGDRRNEMICKVNQEIFKMFNFEEDITLKELNELSSVLDFRDDQNGFLIAFTNSEVAHKSRRVNRAERERKAPENLPF